MKYDYLSITERVSRAVGFVDCENAMSKRMYYRSGCMYREELEELWSNSSETAYTTPAGTLSRLEYYQNFVIAYELAALEKLNSLKECYPILNAVPDFRTILTYPTNFVSNPVIKVSADGKTATGIFYSSGIIADCVTESGVVETDSVYLRYGVDFVIEDGVWKIQKLTVYPDILGKPDGRGFAYSNQSDIKLKSLPDHIKAIMAIPHGATSAHEMWSPTQMPQKNPPQLMYK